VTEQKTDLWERKLCSRASISILGGSNLCSGC